MPFRPQSPSTHTHQHGAPSRAQSGTHPTIYNTLNKAINLAECEVYSYAPDPDFDPHANDYSDDEDEVGSPGDDDAASSDEETQFQFDDYDVDEAPSRNAYRIHLSDETEEYTPHIRMRRRGALLWSSHWFFLNRKLKRILFITVWARSM